MPDASTQQRAPTYVLGHSDPELRRLAEQAAFYADLTEDAFRRAGLAPGMRVLDAGCGAGDVSLLVAALVGPGGAVVGVDRSPEAVATARRRAAAAGVEHARFEVGELEAFAPDASEAGFDAVVGRFVLLYQRDPAATVRALARHVRPGGIVAFQEMDMRAARAVPPAAPTLERCSARIIGVLERAGLEPDMGSKLFRTFGRAGLPSPRMIAASRVEGGADSPAYRYLAETTRSLLPMIEQLGVATAAEVQIDTLEQRLRSDVVEGDCCVVLPTLIAAWCRTPS
jgi:ubiquinone/menaquinone biosynthesis C-methylase UbiE